MVVLKYEHFNKHLNFLNENKSIQDDENNLLRKEVKSDISRCISMILAKYPFFGEYLIECRFLYDYPGVPTMATDGHNIFISSRFAASLTEPQMIFILCHEVLHIMLLHHLRMQNKVGSRPTKEEANHWNWAADLEINPMLVGEGLLSADEVKNAIKGLYDEKYLGWACEVIYDDTPPKSQDDPNGAEYPVNVGDAVESKNGKFGVIEKINADGSYDIKEISKEEAYAIAKSKQ